MQYMMKQEMINYLRFIVINLFLLFVFRVEAQDDEVNIDKIVAKVDNYIILKSELDRAYLDYLSQGELNRGNMRCQILESLIVNKMMVAKAEIDSVEVDDGQVQMQLEQRMSYIIAQVGSEEEIEKFYGKSLQEIEEELFKDVKEQMIIQKMQDEITSGIKVTPSEVKRFFKSIPRDSLPYFSTEVTVAQIVKKPEPGKAQQQKIYDLLLDLRSQILNGASFAELARRYSEDGSGRRGGELPYYSRGEVAPEFEEAAMTLEKGELSMPVKSEFGYHLIELQDKRGNTFKTRHIIISPRPDNYDIQEAEGFLDSLRLVILNDSISFDKAAKEYSDDKNTSSNGGFFVDPDGASRVSVNQLDPNIFFTLDTMQVGNITKPMPFTEADGSRAYRILYFKDKTRPHQANLDDDYQKIAKAALGEKRNRILSEWFEEARGDVFIEIDKEYQYCNLIE